MYQFSGIRPSRGKVVMCSLLAVIIGMLQPAALLFQVMMPMPGICAAMIAAAVMYAGAGLVPVIVFVIFALASSLLFLGAATGGISTFLWIVPAAVMIWGMRGKQAFFRQLMRGIVSAAAVTVLAIALMGLMYGRNMIGMAIDQLRNTFTSQQDLFWEMLSPMLQSAGGGLGKDEFIAAYYEMFNMLQMYYEYYLLSNLFSGAVISAMVGVLCGNWLLARRGEATSESFRGMSEWFLSSNTTFGILLTLAASRLLTGISLYGAETTWIVISSLSALAFAVQCLAAMDRRMKNNGSSVGRRVTLLILLVVFGSTAGPVFFGMEIVDLLAVAGCASALFGQKGAAKPFIKKIMDDKDGEDR